MPIEFAKEFPVEAVWAAAKRVLQNDLGDRVDIDTIGAADFDEEGMLTLRPPAARLLFMDMNAKGFELQRRNYELEMSFGVLCADDDRSPDPQAQRDKSLRLAQRVMHSLAGAVLLLDDGSRSMPIEVVGMKPMPTADLGMAYVPAFRISGIAQFCAPNANPVLPGGQNG